MEAGRKSTPHVGDDHSGLDVLLLSGDGVLDSIPIPYHAQYHAEVGNGSPMMGNIAVVDPWPDII